MVLTIPPRRSHYSLFIIHYSRKREAFTLLELIVVIGIFIVMTGVLLTNFRRSRQGDVVRIAALRLSTDIQRMQAAALSGGGVDPGAAAYGVHVQASQPDRYVLFGDRVRCQEDAQGQQVCAANGRYDAGVDPAEEIANGVVQLATDVRFTNTDPVAETIDILFQPPRGAVVILPNVVEARLTLQHATFNDTRVVSVNRISGRVDVN
ncbi:MAG: type II secretion system protein [bacterium]|nr:type II secretion system protein [bacterium]